MNKQEKLFNRDTQIQAFLNRYKPSVIDEYADYLTELHGRITEEIELATSDLSILRLRQIEGSIIQEMREISQRTVSTLQSNMEETSRAQYDATVGMMVDLFGMSPAVKYPAFSRLPRDTVFAITNPNRAIRVKTLGRKLPNGQRKTRYVLSDEIEYVTGQTSTRFRQILKDAVIRGTSNQEVLRDLKQNYDIATSRSRAQVEAISRTAISDAMDDARNEGFKQFDDVIEGWMWNAVMDNRTTVVCASHSGEVKKRQEDHIDYHWHFNCRVILTPVTDFTDASKITARYHIRDKKTVNTRDGFKKTKFTNADTGVETIQNPNGKGGESASDIWFRSMPDIQINKNGKSVNWKEEYLGKEKYRLYKEHGLNFSDLISRKNGKLRNLTIREIRDNLNLD